MSATLQVQAEGYVSLVKQLVGEFCRKNQDCKYWRDELTADGHLALVSAVGAVNRGELTGDSVEAFLATAIKNALQTSADGRRLVSASARQLQVERREDAVREKELAKQNQCPECGKPNPSRNGYAIDPTTGQKTAVFVDPKTGEESRLYWCAECYERIARQYPRAPKPADTGPFVAEASDPRPGCGNGVADTLADALALCATHQERQVVRLRASGRTETQIAGRIGVSQSTVNQIRRGLANRSLTPPLAKARLASLKITSDRSQPAFRQEEPSLATGV